jgi:arsenite methyltransferase
MMKRTRLLTALTVAGAVFLLPSVAAGQLASRPADEWIKLLESPERVAGLEVAEVVSRLRLKPGSVVADLGAGSGIFSVPLASAVGSSGKVYAVEIDQALLEHIRRKISDAKAANVHPVLGKFTDPALPASDVDLAFLHDVLHHIEDRSGYLKQVPRYLKSEGRIAVVDFNPQSSPHRDDPKLQVSKEETRTLMSEIGFVPVEEFQLFEDKWFVIYAAK